MTEPDRDERERQDRPERDRLAAENRELRRGLRAIAAMVGELLVRGDEGAPPHLAERGVGGDRLADT